MARKRRENPETQVVRACLAYLKLLGVPAWRNNTGAVKREGRFIRFGFAGVSDILGCLPPDGRMLAIEVKAPGGRATQKQEDFLAAIRRAGGVGAVVCSLEDLEEAMGVRKGSRAKC